MPRFTLLIGAFLITALTATGQVTSPPAVTEPADNRQELFQEYRKLQSDLLLLFHNRKYKEAAEVCRRIITLAPDQPDGHYNLACALARQGNKKDALKALADAVKHGWLDSRHTETDEDLASLRQEKDFTNLVAEIQVKEQASFEGKEMPGIKTVRGLPEGGLRYRLRMSPAATSQAPNRLIVWMHPSGGSMNSVIEPLAPTLIRHGFALLVFTQKNFMGWTNDDVPALAKTVEAVGKIEGVNASRPILMGYSAGGQVALQLWLKTPRAYGGLILDAAYPLDFARSQPSRVVVLTPPGDESARTTPMFVLVGEKDGGAMVWRKAETEWSKLGVPLTIQYVPGKGHTWLLGAEQLAALETWLDDVRKQP